MSQVTGLGEMNGPAVGYILKEAMRRAITTIRNQRQVFEVTVKESYAGTMDDVCTTADKAAQEVYLRMIRECFPNAGVIAEEDSLRVDPKNGCTAYFTVDPLDGTKAFVRGQSHGVGSMIALVNNGQVISAYVGDVNTQEIYGYRPDSDKVHRITEFNTSQELGHGTRLPLKKQYVLLRDPLECCYSAESTYSVRNWFKSHIVDGGSIGIWKARMWKREMPAVIIPRGWETPWDSTPIIGISQKLGYKFFKPMNNGIANGWHWHQFNPPLPREKFERKHDVLIIHANDVPSDGSFKMQ